MMKNNSVEEILEELELNEREKQIFLASIRETKLAQINDDVDAKTSIFDMIREEFK